MPSRNIKDRLNAGEVLLLDGATGSELHARGANVSIGATSERLTAWSATVNVDRPDLVRQVHEDYLHLGADLITANSFWTNRPRLAMIGLGDEWERYARAAAQIAIQARNGVNAEAYVAGGIAPPGQGDLRKEFADLSRLLAEERCDLILAEYVGRIEECVTAVDACATAGLPVFLGVRHVTEDGEMQYGESFQELGKALKGHRVDAILLMCSRPTAISASLPRLRQAFDGPIGAYANIGYDKNPEYQGRPGEQWHVIARQTAPAEYAAFGREWIGMGAQIVGGCCATTPAHIEALAPVVKGTTRDATRES